MTHNNYVIPIDPSSMANRFASPEPLLDDRDDSILENEDESFSSLFSPSNFVDNIQPLLSRIPSREADLIEMYFLRRKRQADIAEIFGVTQAAVSYRLERGLKRIRFLLSIPNFTEDDLRRDLPAVPFQNIDVNILVGMWHTTCQSQVASDLGLTQGRVRHRFFAAVKKLQEKAEVDSAFVPHSQLFTSISSKNFNVLREVKLPQWEDRGKDQCF